MIFEPEDTTELISREKQEAKKPVLEKMLSFFVCFFLGNWVAKRRAIYCYYTCSMCVHRCRHIAYAGGIWGTIAHLNIIIAVDLDTIFRRVCMGLVCIFYSSWIRFDGYSYSWIFHFYFFKIKRVFMKFDILGWLLFSFIFLNTSSSLFLYFWINKSFICLLL